MRTLLTALLLLPLLAWAESPGDFAYTAPIATPAATPFQRIPLPGGVYRSVAHDDLRDLRVFNAAGEVVPHALEPRSVTVADKSSAAEVPLFPLPQQPAASPVAGVRVETSGDGTIVSVTRESPAPAATAPDAYLLDASRQDRPVGALELVPAEPAAQFFGRLRVEASDDLEHWRTVASDAPLLVTHAAGQTLSRLRIEWPATKAKYWRASWVGPPTPAGSVTFAKAQLEPAAATREVARTWQSAEPLPLKLNDGEFAYGLPPGAPIDRLRLRLPQLNTVVPVALLTRSRPEEPWRQIGSHTVYRLQQGGVEITSPDLAANPQGQLLLRFDPRGGGLGSGSPVLEIGWIPHTLVFAARGAGPYRLAYGNAQAQGAAYAIDSLVPGYGDGTSGTVAALIGAATLGESAKAAGTTALQAQPDFKRWLLWGVLLAAVLLLGLMAYKLWNQMAKAAPQNEPPRDPGAD